MPVDEVIRLLSSDRRYKEYFTHREVLPQREGAFGNLSLPLTEELEAYLERKEIRLYQHQCLSIEHIRQGEHVIITTPTASGKTLAFNLPIFEYLAQHPKATALYLYPTKAL
ncbi:MAG TPA: DEAD/DEAH box helicase, partial [Methanomicrobiales archaeon]|nr:DEAD/DEAH box helicase [Methanomicrobiales archaeon]